jgi:hypothetical protein
VAERLPPTPSFAPNGHDAGATRTTVMHPQTRAARSAHRRPPLLELQDATQIGDVLIRSLIRAQLGLALRMVAAVGCVLAGLPALFWLAPGLVRFSVFGVPIAWLLLGVAIFPFLVISGWIYNRLADRHEREFSDLVDRP